MFLHEVGEHAALKDMLGAKRYAELSSQFESLLESGDEAAQAAESRIPEDTRLEHVASERLAHLVQEVQDRQARGETVCKEAKTLYTRILNLIRKWLQSLPAWRQLEAKAALRKLDPGKLLTAENITALARAAVDFHAERQEGATDFADAEGNALQFMSATEQGQVRSMGKTVKDFVEQVRKGEPHPRNIVFNLVSREKSTRIQDELGQTMRDGAPEILFGPAGGACQENAS